MSFKSRVADKDKLSTGANGQKPEEDAALPSFVRTVLIELSY